MASSSNNTELVTRTEAALRASEALKTAILETALDAIVTIDDQGHILDFNPAAEKIFAYTREEVIGQEMAQVIIPVHLRERHRMGLARAVASGKDTIVGQRIEITAVRKSGEEFPVELAITRIQTGGPPIFTGHIRDITERKQAELRRATQLAVTRVLAEAATLAEATPQILRAVCESLRWDMGTMWHVENDALRCVDVWHAGGERLNDFEQATRKSTFARGIGLPGRIRLTGEPQWVSDVTHDRNFPRASLAERAGLHGAFAFPIHLGEHVLGVIEFFSREIRQPNADVLEMFFAIGGQIGQFIERKRAEAGIRDLNAALEQRVAEATRGLRESEERFSKAFRASPVFLSIARLSDGKFVEVNEAFLQSSGYTREDVVGHTSVALGLWTNLAQRSAFMREVQRSGFVRQQEVVLRSKDRRLQTLLLSAELINIEGEDHILAVSLDITARKRAEEEMRHALEREKELSRLKTNFVTLVSHEFRTPLAIIMSAADILKKYLDRLSPDRRGEHLQDIHDASRRMAELIDQVLLLARVEAGKMECKPQPLDLPAFCLQLRDELQAAANGAGSIEVKAHRFTGRAMADESLLRHIFTNLLSNALKYSDPGSAVELSVARRERDAIFEVRDRGIGIPAEDIDQLFQTFRRGTNVGERPGTGLGLVIVKRCVELHGGAVDLQSRQGTGTTVIVRLPLFVTQASRRKRPSEMKRRQGHTRKSARVAAKKPKKS